MATTFNVKMDVDDMEGKSILVFMRRAEPQDNEKIHAWQVLGGGSGAADSFEFEPAFSVKVSKTNASLDSADFPDTSVKPGDLLQVAAVPSGEVLETAPDSLAKKMLNPQQVGVINLTAQLAQFNCTWSVNGRPVLTDVYNSEHLGPYINNHPMLTYEFAPHLYFMLASPPVVGQTYLANDLADAVRYDLPATARNVDVTVKKDKGVVGFEFSEVD